MELTVNIASVPDRDDVVAEIWHGQEMMAEVSRVEAGCYIVELYPRPNGKVWEVEYDDLIRVLNSAKERLALLL
jgi:hypothetical protein